MVNDKWREKVAAELAKPAISDLISRARIHKGPDFPGRISVAIDADKLRRVADGEFDVLDVNPAEPRERMYVTVRGLKATVLALRQAAGIS